MGLLKGFFSSEKKDQKTFKQINSESTSHSFSNIQTKENIRVTEEYKLIRDFIKKGKKLIFVTGGAGTGKSTFVKWIDKIYSGEVVIAAPTGVAAITIAGTTIHRLFKFPPAWIVDKDIKKDSKSIITKARILILDEISMVNANVLDSIDKFCRLHRNSKEPFGGIIVIMVGDLFQLPPIVTKITKPLFQREYRSPKFFGAHSIQDIAPIAGVELSIPFRQADSYFINLLQNIREGKNLESTVRELNSKCVITKLPPKGAVHLAPTNKEVDSINLKKLSILNSPSFSYYAKKEGKFSDSQLPAPNQILLKEGAQVVFLNNSKDWFNGSVGIVTSLTNEKIIVKLSRTNKSVEVLPNEWKNYEYFFNEKEKKLERRVVGSYVQYPLTLSWAMTIHKSQGLTLDRVHLSLGAGAFDYGQTYVAISRCRNLNSLTLERKIQLSDIMVDREVIKFYRAIRGE